MATTDAPTAKREESIKGIPVSPGIVIGRVVVLEDDLHRVPRRTVPKEKIPAELASFDGAVAASISQLTEVHKRAEKEMGQQAAQIFLFHVGMLRDKTLLMPIRSMIEKERVNAEYAVSQVFSQLAQKFRSNTDSVFATKVNDIEDLAKRLLRALMDEPEKDPLDLKRAEGGVIVVARDLTPSQTAAFDRTRVLGFVTDLGGRTSHTAIVAKALGIPAVVGLQLVTKLAQEGSTIILDGDEGNVILDPDESTLARYTRFIEQRRVFQLSLHELNTLESVTADGVHIEILGNIEFPDEVEAVLREGGEGVGLYRTEFLYLTSKEEPTEKDHFNAYSRCVKLVQGKQLTIRTVDLGADKYTQLREEVPERNPFLGCRSIRYCLRDIPMFKRQLRAILRASALGPIKIMFPLITSLGEFRHGKLLLNDVMEELEEDGIPFDRGVKVGMMVEVPSAALMADLFAEEADFFSIGTNDLVQYTLAVDRTNERIANLYSPTHPAVIRLIRDVVRASRRHNTPVSCCGESAADLEYAGLLIGFGLRTLSVTSSAIPQLKRFIRSVTVQQCERVARKALTLDSDVQVSALLRDWARKIVPEAFDGRSVD